MKQIPLSQGKVAMVDDEDFKELNKYKWYALKKPKTFYVVRNSPRPKQRPILMHRVIMNAPKGKEIDHRNRDGLDNQRSNLRLCSKSENQHNRIKNKEGASKWKGVYWHKERKKWQSQIQLNGKRIHLGRFENEEKAAKVYDTEARKYFGEFARLNFPKGEQ